MSENTYGQLVEQFMQIQWLLVRHHHNHQAFGLAGNPYRGQGRVLKILKMKPEFTQKELADLLNMRPQSLGALLRKLEQKGYLTRSPAKNDKRAMVIRLTEKGAKAKIQDDRELGIAALFGCLSEEEQHQLSKYLQCIIDNWREGSGQDPEFDHFGFEHFTKWHK